MCQSEKLLLLCFNATKIDQYPLIQFFVGFPHVHIASKRKKAKCINLISPKLAKTWDCPHPGNQDLQIDAHKSLATQLHVVSALHTMYSLYFIFMNINGQAVITSI